MKRKNKGAAVERFAAFIADNRRMLLIVFILLALMSAFTARLAKTNDSLEDYLDEKTETRQGLDIMEKEFVTYGTARVMVNNLSFEQADQLKKLILDISGVNEVEFDDSEQHYWNSYSLFEIKFNGTKDSNVSIKALEKTEALLEPYDSYISTDVGNPLKKIIDREMLVVDVIAFGIILIVLLLTSNTFAEIPVLLITFGAAAIFNMGTNFIFGEISFVTNSIAVVLQLALAMDYAIILMHRYLEEHDGNGLSPRDSVIVALSKAIPEIAGSSLTTVSGLLALTFMKYKLGADMGFVLIKAILISLVCVFTLMPILIMMFSGLIDKTHHRNYMPEIPFISKFVNKTKYVVPPIFLIVFICAAFFSTQTNYVFNQDSVDSLRHNEIQLAEKKIEEVFGKTTTFAIIVPSGNGDGEKTIVREVKALEKTVSVTGLSDIKAKDDHNLLDELSPREFSELAGIDYEMAVLLYRSYALENKEFGLALTGTDNYKIPLLDIFEYLIDNKEKVYLDIDEETEKKLDDLEKDLDEGRKQLQSDNWSRIVVEADISPEGEESYEYLAELKSLTAKTYSKYHIVGDTTSCRDLKVSFDDDNKLISLLSVTFVAAVLLLTFKSAGLPILLLLIIQGSIFINFSSPYFTGNSVFFVTYLIITSIQMGANIDYAIVISGRYLDFRNKYDAKSAMKYALEAAFPTIFSSGSMLTSAGVVIALVTSNETISAVGVYLGKGTFVSMILVLCVLPQIIILGDKLIHKTKFTLQSEAPAVDIAGKVVLNGKVSGYVNGYVNGEIYGSFDGEIKASVENCKRDEDGAKDEE